MAYNCTGTVQCYSQQTGEPTHEAGPFGGYTSIDTEGNSYCNISMNPAVASGNACGAQAVAPQIGKGPRRGGFRPTGSRPQAFRSQSGGQNDMFLAGQEAARAAYEAGGVNALLAFLAGFEG